jgi:hypothetical protein
VRIAQSTIPAVVPVTSQNSALFRLDLMKKIHAMQAASVETTSAGIMMTKRA